MLAVQEYLSSGKTLDNLNEEFGIKVCYHDTLPLVILNYDQISSPKTHPITMCCRGLILEVGIWKIVAASFSRFFNLGECEELQKDFDWSNFVALEKVDGSLINMFFYANEWHMATRGSFGEGLMENCNFSWKELFWKTFNEQFLSDCSMDQFDPTMSYTMELCSRYNKVVTDYPEPVLYVLNWYDKEYNSFAMFDSLSLVDYWNTPARYSFKSIDEVINHIEDLELNNPTIEGVVLVDKYLNRIKVKNKKYISLHKMRGESGFTMKNLLPFVIDGEVEELLTYYPELREKIDQMDCLFGQVLIECDDVWNAVHEITDQKEFALKLIGHKCLFQDVFFSMKRDNTIADGKIDPLIRKHPKLYERVFKQYDKESLV
jgi:hypothetical protein